MKFLYDYCGFSRKNIANVGKHLLPYIRRVRKIGQTDGYKTAESFVNLPFDNELVGNVRRVVREKVTKQLKYVIVIGIGGSNLGAKAVYDALFGYFDVLTPHYFPKMLWVDAVDGAFLTQLNTLFKLEIKDQKELLVVMISKSGTTTETVADAEIVLQSLEKKFSRQFVLDRTVIITDKDSGLWKRSGAFGITRLWVPEKMNGRYSVFSAVGLFPLTACGVDIKTLLDGAGRGRLACLSENLFKNPAAVSAAVIFLANKKGKTIHDTFIFEPALESVGKWYRQLVGESLGKEYNREGKVVHAGITPTVSIGSVDLHSVGQLYLGGPRDKITTFVSVERGPDIKVPGQQLFPDLVEGISGRSTREIMSTILTGVKVAYRKRKLPLMEIILPDVSARSIGEFLQFKMLEVMYLGQLMEVNAFDQPNVEEYKQVTRHILKTS